MTITEIVDIFVFGYIMGGFSVALAVDLRRRYMARKEERRWQKIIEAREANEEE